jgi:hypothetical protein
MKIIKHMSKEGQVFILNIHQLSTVKKERESNKQTSFKVKSGGVGVGKGCGRVVNGKHKFTYLNRL